MTQPTKAEVLEVYASLPESYQPAWGLNESRGQARRVCDDRLAVLLAVATAFPGDGPLRILDIGCAQGYFTLALKHELEQRGRSVEIIGVDYLEANIHFCRMLAAHHGVNAKFVHDRFDAEFFERHSLPDFDIVLALNVLHHVRELDGECAVMAVLQSICQHAVALLCELAQPAEALDWIGQWHDSDDELLAGFAFRRRLADFGTHLTQVKRPLYVCSNSYTYVGSRWFAFDHCADRAHAGIPDRFANQRRFFLGQDAVVKCYRGEGDYAAFNRAEISAELSVLTVLGDEPKRYPPVLAYADDGDTIWLARGKLSGRLLSELIDVCEAPDSDVLVRALLEELAHLESRGFHHADIRAWNILWDGTSLFLIDFGSLTPHASPLHRVALVAVLAEIACGKLDHGSLFYCTFHPLELYPAAWQSLLRYLLETSQQDFRYAEALVSFMHGDDFLQDTKTSSCADRLTVGTDVLNTSLRELAQSFERQEQHAENLQQALRKTIVDAEAERDTFRVSLHEASQYARTLEARIERETKEMDSERNAAQVALQQAATHNQAMDSERNAAQTALQQAAAHSQALETEQVALRQRLLQSDANCLELQKDVARLRYRFRWLRPLMPKDLRQARDSE